MKAGLTVEDVVERLASQGIIVAVGTYYHWEAGRRVVPLDAAPSLAVALGVKKISKLFPD